MKHITAGIIIIGNEILSGRTQDSNTHFIASKLPEAGIHLEEVRIIPDIKDVIINTSREFSSRFNYVFTTGGIGPTHDDITADAISEAFNRKCIINHKALKSIKEGYKKMKREMPKVAEKMAMMPEGAGLIENEVTSAPGFYIENIYVMAGIPEIMKSMFTSLLPGLSKGKPVISKQISILIGESRIANRLNDLQHRYPDIEMGSYPFKYEGKHSTSLVLRGDEIAELEEAYIELKNMVKEYEIIA